MTKEPPALVFFGLMADPPGFNQFYSRGMHLVQRQGKKPGEVHHTLDDAPRQSKMGPAHEMVNYFVQPGLMASHDTLLKIAQHG